MAAFTDLVDADDVTTVIWAETEEDLVWQPKTDRLTAQEVIKSIGLPINTKKLNTE